MPPATNKIPCTVAVLTFNSASGLRRCLESAKEFQEILICDGGSTDETLEIAKEYGCAVIYQDAQFKDDTGKISDFSGVRNQTLKAASCDWFLILDSDEYLSSAVVEELATIIKNDNKQAPKLFQMLRKFEVDGKIIDCAGTYPSYQPRFFHRNHVLYFARKLHEKIVPKPRVTYGYTKQATIVPLTIDIPTMRSKHRYYLSIEKERSVSLPKSHLLKAIIFNLRGAAARWVKIGINFFTCRGNRMPLSFEWTSTVYSLKLSYDLATILWKKLLTRHP
jgi:glycosyltransferase involved in cell wall biosynthesis